MKKAGAYITISVDDGHPADRRTAALLNRYGLKATFYIPRTNPEREVLGEAGIRELARSFEVGGHTSNHAPLRGLSDAEVHKEIGDGKDWMQQLLGKPVVAFCYPRGKFDSSVARAVKAAGFKGARTCMYNLYDFPRDPYYWGVSTHAYSHSRAVQVRHALLERNVAGAMNFFTVNKGAVDWVAHFKHAVDYVVANEGIAHLYLHSWEIEALNQWKRLEDVLKYVSQTNELIRVTNGELFIMYHENKRGVDE